MRRLAASSFCLLLAFATHAQNTNSRYDNIAWSSSYVAGAQVLVPVANLSVQVCTYPANAVPCTNYATLYYGPATNSGVAPNPIVSDAQGNFGFWTAAGYYQYTVTNSLGQSAGPYSITLGGSGGGGGGGGATFPPTAGVVFNTSSASSTNATSAQIATALNLTPTTTLAPALLPPATNFALGGVRPDGTTITVSGAGVISSTGGGGASLPATSLLYKGNGVVNGALAAIPGTDYVIPSGTAANLSGTPTLPSGTAAFTQSPGDNSTKLATDAFVVANAGAGTPATSNLLKGSGAANGVVAAVPTTDYVIPSQIATFFANPMSTLGDVIYGGAGGVATRLAGNPNTNAEVLVSQGGGVAAPTTKTCKAYTASGTSATCTWSTSLAAGEFVVFGVKNGVTNSLTMTDSGGNTYAAVAAPHAIVNFYGYTQLFYFGPLAAPITTSTVTGANSDYFIMQGDTAASISPSSPVDGAPCYADTNFTSTVSCGTVLTTTTANDYVFCYANNVTSGDVFSAGSGFTAGASYDTSNLAQYKVQSAVGALTPSITSSGTNAATMNCAAFKPGGFPAAPTLSNVPAISTINMTMQNKVINGISYSQFYSGATEDARANDCLNDALTGNNGNTSRLCDASGEQGNQEIASTLVIGDENNDPVGLILPCGPVYWTGFMTSGPVVHQYGGTTVTSNCASNGPQMQFTTYSTSNPSYIYEIDGGTSGNAPYVYDHGFQIANNGGGSHATSTGIGFIMIGQIADASTLDEVNVYDGLDLVAAEIYGACCQTTWTHSSINAAYYGTPLKILTDSTNFTRDFTYTNGSIVHPGSAQSAVDCEDTRNSTVSSFALDHIYMETGQSANPNPEILSNGCSRMSISHITMPQYGTAAFPAVSITSAYNTMAVVDDIWFTYGSGPWTYPNPAVINAYTGQTINSDSNGYFAHYQTPTATSTLGASTTLGDLAYGGASGVSSRLPGNATATDEVLVSHGTGVTGATPTTKTCNGGGTGTPTGTCTWSASPVAGEFVAAWVASYTSGHTFSMTDSAGNTYTPVAAARPPTYAPGQTQMFYFGPLASSITTMTVTATGSASGNVLSLVGDTSTNVASSLALDGAPCYADNGGSTGTISCSTALNTTAANDYVFCGSILEGGTLTAGSGFTAGANPTGANLLAQYKVQSAIGTLTPSIVSGAAVELTMTCAAFKPPLATAAPTLVNNPTLRLNSYTVSTLPAASSYPAGTQFRVSDSTSFTPGTCTGGGSDDMIAIDSGTAWSCH